MGFGFQTSEPKLGDPYAAGGLVSVPSSLGTIDTTPDEARLYALKLLKAADKAEELDR